MLDKSGEFVKRPDAGMTDELWAEMVAYANDRGLKGGAYKKMNLPFENKMLGQPAAIRARSAKAVEDFVYHLLTEVFNAADTAPLGIEAILAAGSYDLGHKAERIEDPADWTTEKIRERAKTLCKEEGPEGDFDD